MRAADVGRIPGLGRAFDESLYTLAARDAVHRSIDRLGGMHSPGGSCLWHVIGLEMSLKEWSAIQSLHNGRPWHPMAASGILATALGVLVE
jgi:hypothetical protein